MPTVPSKKPARIVSTAYSWLNITLRIPNSWVSWSTWNVCWRHIRRWPWWNHQPAVRSRTTLSQYSQARQEFDDFRLLRREAQRSSYDDVRREESFQPSSGETRGARDDAALPRVGEHDQDARDLQLHQQQMQEAVLTLSNHMAGKENRLNRLEMAEIEEEQMAANLRDVTG